MQARIAKLHYFILNASFNNVIVIENQGLVDLTKIARQQWLVSNTNLNHYKNYTTNTTLLTFSMYIDIIHTMKSQGQFEKPTPAVPKGHTAVPPWLPHRGTVK